MFQRFLYVGIKQKIMIILFLGILALLPVAQSQSLAAVTSPLTTDCGRNGKSCFRVPEDCVADGRFSNNCLFLVTYRRTADGRAIEFDIATNQGAFPNRYLAVGFSPDGNMANSAITMCLWNGFSAQILLGIVPSGHNFQRITNRQLENTLVSDVVGAVINNNLICHFKQQIRSSDVSQVYNLNDFRHLIVSTGDYSSNDPQNPMPRQHSRDARYASPTRLRISSGTSALTSQFSGFFLLLLIAMLLT